MRESRSDVDNETSASGGRDGRRTAQRRDANKREAPAVGRRDAGFPRRASRLSVPVRFPPVFGAGAATFPA